MTRSFSRASETGPRRSFAISVAVARLLRNRIRLVIVVVVMSLLVAAMFSVPPTDGAAHLGPVATDAPTNLVVTATSSASIRLSWTAPPTSVTQYQIERRENVSGQFIRVANTAGTVFTDTTVTSLRAYLYRVRAVRIDGNQSCPSNSALGTAISFEFNQLQGQPIRARHLHDVRTAINAVRALANLPPANWTQPTLNGLEIKAQDVQELRNRLSEALNSLGVPVGPYQDPVLNTGANGTTVRAIHIEQLQTQSTRGVQLAAEQSQQPIKYFGYVDATEDLSKVSEYTNFTYIGGVYNEDINDKVRNIQANGMRAIIDLSQVLFCPPDSTSPTWRICSERWDQWASNHSAILKQTHILALSIFNEPSLNNVKATDVEEAVRLVKEKSIEIQSIPTMVVEFYGNVFDAGFQVPKNVDWIALDGFKIHPNLEKLLKESVELLKQKKQSCQRTGYALDAFHGDEHCSLGVAPTAEDMDTIAQEWYTFASRDPDAIVLGAHAWFDLTGERAIGTRSFPQSVRDKHEAIGKAILSGKVPSYQGSFDRIDCQSLSGWAWDASQPDTPISVDIYDGAQKIATVRANESINNGIGNGRHGFTAALPASLYDGQTHWISIKFGGLEEQLALSPRPVACTAPPYEGWIDVADCNSIVGWAADRSRLNTSITVSIFDGDTFVTSVLASDLRSDVSSHLGDNGRHGFAIPTPTRFKDGLQHSLRVKFESRAMELSTSPRTIIACATQPLYYEISARHSGKCLDVELESIAAGARVIQYTCGGWLNQQWQIIPIGGGYYKIVARHSGKVLDVQGAGLSNGTPVWQWDENGTPAQQWQIIDVGCGYSRIIARHSGKAIDVAGGSKDDVTPVHQWDYVGIPNQQWLLRPLTQSMSGEAESITGDARVIERSCAWYANQQRQISDGNRRHKVVARDSNSSTVRVRRRTR